ncbi:MAG: superinfection immunity protein [Deltaproteobacteria bacterium]|nr:superinfection immunity protein [Deltaproteobacteria bacterium]
MDGPIFILILIVGGFPLYILPFIIARIRGAEHRTGILWVNLLFGWTVLGWLAALIWSVTEETAPRLQPAQPRPEKATQARDFHEGRTKDEIRVERVKQTDRWVLE